MVEPNGSRVFLAAAPGTRWSIVLASAKPPVALVQDEPGWTLSSGFGPEYAFATHGVSFSNGLEGPGRLRIELECAGPKQQIEVTVDLTEPLGDNGKTFLANCTPDGARTGETFTTKSAYDVSFLAPAGTWTAATALLPETVPAAP
jgi:hypothetical protein